MGVHGRSKGVGVMLAKKIYIKKILRREENIIRCDENGSENFSLGDKVVRAPFTGRNIHSQLRS